MALPKLERRPSSERGLRVSSFGDRELAKGRSKDAIAQTGSFARFLGGEVSDWGRSASEIVVDGAVSSGQAAAATIFH